VVKLQPQGAAAGNHVRSGGVGRPARPLYRDLLVAAWLRRVGESGGTSRCRPWPRRLPHLDPFLQQDLVGIAIYLGEKDDFHLVARRVESPPHVGTQAFQGGQVTCLDDEGRSARSLGFPVVGTGPRWSQVRHFPYGRLHHHLDALVPVNVSSRPC